jgi:hypothetical protein
LGEDGDEFFSTDFGGKPLANVPTWRHCQWFFRLRKNSAEDEKKVFPRLVCALGHRALRERMDNPLTGEPPTGCPHLPH